MRKRNKWQHAADRRQKQLEHEEQMAARPLCQDCKAKPSCFHLRDGMHLCRPCYQKRQEREAHNDSNETASPKKEA